MTRAILINGLLPYDSGKTWFTIALARLLMSKNYKVMLYKPIAAHSAWYQFSTLLNSLKHGVLIGEDVIKYIKLLGLNYSFEMINPIDFMSAPLNPNVFSNVRDYLASLGNLFEQLVFVRISDFMKETKHYIIKGKIEKTIPSLKPWLNRLVDKLKPEIRTLKEIFKVIYSKSTIRILEHNLNILLSDSDFVLVESFSDASVPYYDLLEKTSTVITVAPGYFYVLNAKEFKEAVRKSYMKYGDLGLRTNIIIEKVTKLLENSIFPSSSILDLKIEDKILKILEK